MQDRSPQQPPPLDNVLEVFAVAGYQFHLGCELRMELCLQHGDPLLFIREPNNPYDSRAIAITTLAGITLGYMPRHLNTYFAMLLDLGIHLEPYVYYTWPLAEPWRRVVVGVKAG